MLKYQQRLFKLNTLTINSKSWRTFMRKIKFNIFNLKAFTLAEVLITLGIIGIVAALTIPQLVANYTSTQLKVQWKKTYSIFEQATQNIIRENGSMKGLDCDSWVVDTCLKNYYSSFIKIKEEDDHTRGNCWHNAGEWKSMDGTSMDLPNGHDACIVLNDGTLINFENYDSACTNDDCGLLQVDVNGFKKPNIIGKDIFRIHVGEYKTWLEKNYCNTNVNGWGCGYYYLLNN